MAPTRGPRWDAGPTAVARPVNKAPERGTVITPSCNDGGARKRVPPASDALFFCARDRSRMAETPCGSVHESPVRPLPHALKRNSNDDQARRIWTSSRAFVCASWI